MSLDCPHLTNLKLIELDALQEMNRLPDGIEKLEVEGTGFGAILLEQVLPVQGLKHLSGLSLDDCPGQPIIVREAYIASKLTALHVDDAWASSLFPCQPPWQGLPCNLQHVSLRLSLDNGIPLVLEQLRSLVTIQLRDGGEGPMHITRPPNPFLDMPSPTSLTLSGDEAQPVGQCR